ncbi:MAG TPA: flagellar hook-basal body complex protein FliE [Steroidobacteraceae bacterium]|nr:flagellar hook-basal body complex protein FliE [Steroidobacteraceae bacterium]
MTPVDLNRVLADMRALAAQAGNKSAEAVAAPQMDFGALLSNSINRVNDMQRNAESLANAFETGAKDVDVAQVMVEVQKAGLAFRAMTEVRNKLVQAYQDVMNMPL